jgi:hypothetical protein
MKAMPLSAVWSTSASLSRSSLFSRFLHAGYGGDRERAVERLAVHVGEADVADLARAPRRLQRADALLDGHARVGAVELEQVDAVEPQADQRLVHLPRERRGRSVHHDFGRPALVDAALGRGHDARRVRWSASAISASLWTGAVRPGGVEEAHAEFDGAAQEGLAAFPIGVGAEVARLAGEAHGAEADAGDDEVATDGEDAGHGGAPARVRRQVGDGRGHLGASGRLRRHGNWSGRPPSGMRAASTPLIAGAKQSSPWQPTSAWSPPSSRPRAACPSRTRPRRSA